MSNHLVGYAAGLARAAGLVEKHGQRDLALRAIERQLGRVARLREALAPDECAVRHDPKNAGNAMPVELL